KIRRSQCSQPLAPASAGAVCASRWVRMRPGCDQAVRIGDQVSSDLNLAKRLPDQRLLTRQLDEVSRALMTRQLPPVATDFMSMFPRPSSRANGALTLHEMPAGPRLKTISAL